MSVRVDLLLKQLERCCPEHSDEELGCSEIHIDGRLRLVAQANSRHLIKIDHHRISPPVMVIHQSGFELIRISTLPAREGHVYCQITAAEAARLVSFLAMRHRHGAAVWTNIGASCELADQYVGSRVIEPAVFSGQTSFDRRAIRRTDEERLKARCNDMLRDTERRQQRPGRRYHR